MVIPSGNRMEVFRSCAREVLCLMPNPADFVIMDNLSPLERNATLRLIREAGAKVLFLTGAPVLYL